MLIYTTAGPEPPMPDWFESSLGRFLLKQEQLYCRKLIPLEYYQSGLQVGQPSINFLDEIEVGKHFFIGEHPPRNTHAESSGHPSPHVAIAKASAMPFTDKTHNLIILPHTLDFCEQPHAVLREVHQILAGNGCAVFTGFNPLSIWGAIRLLKLTSKRAPWNGRYHRIGQVQDWLSLLNFELIGARMIYYQPPLQSEKWRRRLAFIDTIGERWLPAIGAVYVLVVRKAEMTVSTPSRQRLSWQKRLLSSVAQPVAQNVGTPNSGNNPHEHA